MRLIIAGGRDIFPSYNMIESFIQYFNLHAMEEIVNGGADGVDSCGKAFREDFNKAQLIMNELYGYQLPPLGLKTIDAEWKKYGNPAGPIRNREMAKYADALLLIWDGTSKGSSNMKSEMLKLNKPVYEVILRSHNE